MPCQVAKLAALVLLTYSTLVRCAVVSTVEELAWALNAEEQHIIVVEHLDLDIEALTQTWTIAIDIPTTTKSFTVSFHHLCVRGVCLYSLKCALQYSRAARTSCLYSLAAALINAQNIYQELQFANICSHNLRASSSTCRPSCACKAHKSNDHAGGLRDCELTNNSYVWSSSSIWCTSCAKCARLCMTYKQARGAHVTLSQWVDVHQCVDECTSRDLM